MQARACSQKASSIREKCKTRGFNFKLTPLNDSELEGEWVLAQSPYIKVSGHKVTEEIFEDLTVEATLHNGSKRLSPSSRAPTTRRGWCN